MLLYNWDIPVGYNKELLLSLRYHIIYDCREINVLLDRIKNQIPVEVEFLRDVNF